MGSKGTLAVLVLLVLGLGALWFVRQRERARGAPALDEYPLCPGLAPARVRALRIEHVERGFQLGLERDSSGRWFLTDPLAYPAQNALVTTLLQMLESARGEPVEGADPAQLGLDPPAVVIECVQLGEGGESRVRVELGKADVVDSLMYARVPGHPRSTGSGAADAIFRTTRALLNTLERNPDDYRDPRATSLLAQEVISIRRRGQIYRPALKIQDSLDFDALLGPDGWKRATPTVSLDPTAMGLLARGAAELAIDRFADDSPQDLARYGLDPPLFTLELEDLAGQKVRLRFGHEVATTERAIGDLTWFCQREGYAHVWQVRPRDVELLTQPCDLFYDQLVVRMLRADVARLELEGDGGLRVLSREHQRDQERWLVSAPAGAEDSAAPSYPGDASAIEAALALLERVQLGEYLPSVRFARADPPLSFHVVLKNGARLGGVLGGPARDEQSGAQGLQYLRDDDEVVALIGADVAELCRRPLDSFRSRKVHQLQESLAHWIELHHGTRTYTFVNSGDNLWSPKGQAIQAPQDFVQSLDGLLSLEARRWLEPDEAQALAGELGAAGIAVLVQPREGEALRFTLGRTADGRTLCSSAAGETAEIDPALLDRLLKLF